MSIPGRPRLYLIDGYALIFRAFHALGGGAPLRNARGENTGMAKGVSDFIKRLIEKHKPDYLGWVNDAGSSGREELLESYKANRVALPDEEQEDFDTGVERVHQILKGYRIPMLELEGFEADDVIASLAKQGAAQDLEVCVVSGDKDLLQMVRPKVWILNPWHGPPGRTTEKWYGVENAHERLGVPAERVIDYLALVGDTADNVPGVKGIGDKGAVELVQQFGALEDILANVDKITKKRPREALQAQEHEARLSKELVTIRCDLPVALDLDARRVDAPDLQKLKDLYVELEFYALARNIGTLLDQQSSDSARAARAEDAAKRGVRYETVDTVQALNRLVTRALKARFIAVDTETILEPGLGGTGRVDALRARLVGISIALAPGEAYYLPLAHREWTPDQTELGLGGTDDDRTPAVTDAEVGAGIVKPGGDPADGDRLNIDPSADESASVNANPGAALDAA